MEHIDHPVQVSHTAIAIAFLIPLAVAGLTAILLAEAGPHEVVLAGVPRGDLGRLEAVPESLAKIPKAEAVSLAVRAIPGEVFDARVREVALARHAGNFEGDPSRGRLVWVVNFANPDDLGSRFIGGPHDRDRSCDWSVHYDYVFVMIDAETGDFITSAERGALDPSRAPRSSGFQVTAAERLRCERLLEQQRALAESLTP